MLRWGIVIVILVAVAAGAYREGRQHAEQVAAEQAEKARLDAARAQRTAVEAEASKGRQEITRWRQQAARHEAEARRLRTAAATAAKDVKAAAKAGEDLVAKGTTDEIMAAMRARGYHPERCQVVGVVRPIPVQQP